MKTFLHLWQYLAEFLLECEIFQIKFVQKIKTHILCPAIFFPENYEVMWKTVVEPEGPQITSQYGAHALREG
jgi:hypothetical protein